MRDEARGIGASMAIVDTDEGSKGSNLDLALVFERSVGLDDGDGQVAVHVVGRGVLLVHGFVQVEVLVPEERVLVMD